jgi:hypothetical protein
LCGLGGQLRLEQFGLFPARTEAHGLAVHDGSLAANVGDGSDGFRVAAQVVPVGRARLVVFAVDTELHGSIPRSIVGKGGAEAEDYDKKKGHAKVGGAVVAAVLRLGERTDGLLTGGRVEVDHFFAPFA